MRSLTLVAIVMLAGCGDNGPAAGRDAAGSAETRDLVFLRQPGEPGKPRVLVYTFENYWRHVSNISCMDALLAMTATRGFAIEVTNHPEAINATTLSGIDVVAFCVTSGDGLSARSKNDLETWIRAGGGTVGFHSASMTEATWPFYVDHVGTYFATHAPGLFTGTLNVTPSHPITSGLSDFPLTEEWYSFAQRPETIAGTQVLLAVDESTLPPEYPAENKLGYHAIAWVSERDGGRMFYAAFGHNPATFADPSAVEIIGRAIEWAAHQR